MSVQAAAISRTLGLALVLALVATATPAAHAQGTGKPDPKQAEAGETIYNDNCQGCHGQDLVSPGQSFDLRGLRSTDRGRFQNVMLKGKGQMPAWQGVLDDRQFDAVWAYIMSKSG